MDSYVLKNYPVLDKRNGFMLLRFNSPAMGKTEGIPPGG